VEIDTASLMRQDASSYSKLAREETQMLKGTKEIIMHEEKAEKNLKCLNRCVALQATVLDPTSFENE